MLVRCYLLIRFQKSLQIILVITVFRKVILKKIIIFKANYNATSFVASPCEYCTERITIKNSDHEKTLHQCGHARSMSFPCAKGELAEGHPILHTGFSHDNDPHY